MPKSATDVMNDVIFAAVLDAVAALKAASNGVPNNLLRDLNAIHANTAAGDLPAGLQSTIAASVREAFTRLAREGYTVAPSRGSDRPPPPRVPSHPPRPRDGRPSRPPGSGAPRKPRDGRPGGGRPKPPKS